MLSIHQTVYQANWTVITPQQFYQLFLLLLINRMSLNRWTRSIRSKAVLIFWFIGWISIQMSDETGLRYQLVRNFFWTKSRCGMLLFSSFSTLNCILLSSIAFQTRKQWRMYKMRRKCVFRWSKSKVYAWLSCGALNVRVPMAYFAQIILRGKFLK